MDSKKLSLRIFLVFSILFLILIYRAYVINQPCNHHLEPIDKSNRISIGDEIVRRLQTALSFKTISFGKNDQNTSAFVDYLKFIKSGKKRFKKFFDQFFFVLLFFPLRI